MYSGLGTYYLKNGQPATVLYVGDVMGFNVPGYSEIWLDQYQNGALQFSGLMSLPMPPYVLQPRDVGTFTASVYQVRNGKKYDLIGSDQIQVQPTPILAQGPYQMTPPPTVQQIPAPGYINPTTTPGGQTILSTGVATPSQPLPGGGSQTSIYYQQGPPLGTESTSTADVASGEGGISPALLAVAGIGLLILFSGRGRK